MANKNLFSSRKRGPKTDMINEAGGKAYRFKNTHALAQLAATGCLSDVFYARADTQLDKVLELCQGVDPLFVAKTAVYARKRGYMKDMPALLCAYLSTVDPELLRRVFPIVIDNAKMLRNFVQNWPTSSRWFTQRRKPSGVKHSTGTCCDVSTPSGTCHRS